MRTKTFFLILLSLLISSCSVKKPVDYFVFASSGSDDIFIFKNKIGKYTILDNDTVQFEEPPIKF